MVAEAPPQEVIYAAPPRTYAWWAAVAGALVFTVTLAWIVSRMTWTPWVGVAIAVVLLVSFAAPTLLGRSAPLRARRVLVDHARREIRIEHARGVVTVPFDDVAEVVADEALVGEGVPLDVVRVTRKANGHLTFGVIDRGAAQGAARALQSVLTPPAS